MQTELESIKREAQLIQSHIKLCWSIQDFINSERIQESAKRIEELVNKIQQERR